MKKENEAEVKEIELDDSYVCAVFALENSRNLLNKPFQIQPYLKAPGQVAWRIAGCNIMQTLERIYNDVPVPINSYIKALKEVRSSIFLYKQL